MKMYLVGGAVRDELLGVHSKDQDFTIVLEPHDFGMGARLDLFTVMKFNLVQMGFEIFLETPEFLTIRARFPKDHKNANLTADFVLARKESDYTDGRRPDKVEPGTLMDDLSRRDFTMNAIAKDMNGELIDPFDGVQDIKNGVIRTVGDPHERFKEDALRIIRAIRFDVTKGFFITSNTADAMFALRHTVAGVSAERVREELTKMFNANPMRTILSLQHYDLLRIVFDMGINFQPTMKERIR